MVDMVVIAGSHALASGVRLVIKVTFCALERRRMKKEDISQNEIDKKPAEKAPSFALKVMRKIFPNGETEFQLVDPMSVYQRRIRHFKHPHELKQVEMQEEFICFSCGENGRGKRYTCQQKNCQHSSGFGLHLVCASPPTVLFCESPIQNIPSQQAQLRLIKTIAHKEHQVKQIHKNTMFKCARCKTKGNGTRYHCEPCKVDLHQVCAEHPIRMLSFMHPQHELVLRTKDVFMACALCQQIEDPNTRMYVCNTCGFHLHAACSQWPQYLVHSTHPPHPLQLKYVKSPPKKQCDHAENCGKKCRKWRYVCDDCDANFHLNCIVSKREMSGGGGGGGTVRDILREYFVQYAFDLVVGPFMKGLNL